MQPWNEGQPPAMRASHAERERTVDVLRAGYAEGRLSKAEYEARVEQTYESVTYGELHQLIVDLPQGPSPVPQQQPQPQGFGPPMMPMPVPMPHTFLPAPPPPTNGSAVGALVCAVMVPFYGLTAIPAVILGHKARAEIRRTGERGEGMAMAGVVIGWLTIGFGTLLLLLIAGLS